VGLEKLRPEKEHRTTWGAVMSNNRPDLDKDTVPPGLLAAGGAAHSAPPADVSSDYDPDGTPALALLLRAQLALGKTEEAARTMARLAEKPISPERIEAQVGYALAIDDLMMARTILADAEAGGATRKSESAQIKARIAMAERDFLAAKAILAAAVEADPDNGALRRLMAEVMVASGSAADVRAVLAHLGQMPVNPPAPKAPGDDQDGDHPNRVTG